jgi:hypothetical protein
MTPTWAVILVGLGSAILGTLLATLLTISHERAAELRAHMLSAADEFSTGTIWALQQARIAAGEVKKDDTTSLGDERNFGPEIQAHLDKANDHVDEVLAKQARIHLLFGDQSPTGLAAAGVTSQLRNMLMALEHRPDSIRDHDEMSRYSRNFTSTLEQHEKFNLAALVALQQTWWDRLRERRRLRRRSTQQP